MTPLRMGTTTVPGVTAHELTEKAQALGAALASGGDQLDPQARATGQQVLDKVAQRTALRGGHTIVALAGATGSGKSSLFNALVGAPVAAVGARRPTTALPTAAVWGGEDATELLDWLSVGQRHLVGSGARDGEAGSLDGLVLLDLPDFDSRVTAHREEAERVLALVDVFVWVTDPQKYADARLHDDYLHALSTHDAVTLVVLNQADRLAAAGVRELVSDLARLAALDGLGSVQVLPTSALTGDGVPALRQRLANAVAAQNAARHRLAADIRSVAARLRRGVADSEPSLPAGADAELVDALCRTAGVPTVVAAVERDYRHEAWARTGWPFTRWARALRPDPLRRLRLDQRESALPGVSAADVRSVLGRSSLPPPTPAARAAVELATRRVGDAAGQGLPVRWSEAVADAATPPGPDVTDALDQAVVQTSLRARAPLWWTAFGVLQLVLALAAVAGLGWLTALAVIGWLQLPQVGTPSWGPLPLPFLLLVGGVVGGLLLAALSRALARTGARRRAELIRSRLVEAVSAVAQQRIVEPARAVLARHAQARTELDRARS